MLFAVFSFSLILSAILTFGVRQIALKFEVVPKNCYRRNQKGTIALWGGIGIYLTLAACFLWQPNDLLRNLLVAAFPLIVMGILDDRYELRAGPKFFVQFAAALLWIYLTQRQNLLLKTGLPSFLAYSISALWIVGLCNAFNLIDGSDGQCSTVGLIGFGVIAMSFPSLGATALPLAGAVLGFLVWNRPPAKIYLGESGSTFMGFATAAMTLSLPIGKMPGAMILGSLFLAAFPLTDTVLAIGRRALKGRPLFSGDKDHIHHILKKVGFSRTMVLAIVGFMVMAGDLTAYSIFKTSELSTAFILTFNNALLMSFILAGLFYMKSNSAQKVSYFGKSLLEKHILHLNEYPVSQSVQKAYLLDLLPYYAELQAEGVTRIVDFIKEISKHFENSKDCRFFSVGSYSVAVTYDNGEVWQPEDQAVINESLIEIFSRYGVLRSLSDTPEGLTYYDKENIEDLLGLLSEHPKELQKPVLQRVG